MIKYLEKKEDFNEFIKERCLVDFYANWCGPCQMLGTVLEKIENELGVSVLKVNTDEFQELAIKYGVMSIPTVILFENGEEIKKHIGFMKAEEIKEFIK